MKTARQAVVTCLGLVRCQSLRHDRLFHLALLAGWGFWACLWCWGRVTLITAADLLSPMFLSLALWQPLLEELLFRGYLQGLLCQQSWGRQCWRGLTWANIVTSLLFVLGHFWAHPPLWAVAVFGPSLLFGYFRDRYASVYPAIALHTFYNAGYFALTGNR